MTDECLRNLILTLYDEKVAAVGESVKSSDIYEAVAVEPTIADLLSQQPRNLAAEGRALVAAVMAPIRRTRRSGMADDILRLLDTLAAPDEGTYMDPILLMAYPLGTPDGMDKTWGLWTPQDKDTCVLMAYRKAGESMAAAVHLDQAEDKAKEAMLIAGVGLWRELWSA